MKWNEHNEKKLCLQCVPTPSGSDHCPDSWNEKDWSPANCLDYHDKNWNDIKNISYHKIHNN